MNRITYILAAGISGLAIASAAHAADLIIEEPVEAGVVDVSGTWDGVYLGAFAGHGWATTEGNGMEFDLSGWLAGVTLGANFTVTDGIVAGVVGDIAWSDISGLTGAADTDITWVGSLRGRIGFDGGAFLPYLTGGLAAAGANFSIPMPAEDAHTYIGWTVGAGVEVAVAEDLSLDLLYRYSDYGSQDVTLGVTVPIELTTHQVTVGLNWRF